MGELWAMDGCQYACDKTCYSPYSAMFMGFYTPPQLFG